jgi:hypothetical protein
MPGFYAASPDPERKPSIGEQLDARLMLDEQTFQAMGGQLEEQRARIAALEAAVAVLEALLLGGVPAG